MRVLALAVVAAVGLGGAFGEASATVDSISGDEMVVDIKVEVVVSASAVVAHLAFDEDPTLALPLLDRDDGTFGIVTELEAKNYVVVFEAIGAEDGLSEPVSLTELGADLGQGGDGGSSSEGDSDDGLSDETRQLGWLALALAAASLSALAFWVLGGRDREEAAEEEE